MMKQPYSKNPVYRFQCSSISLVRWDASKLITIILFTIALQPFGIESWTLHHPLTSSRQQQSHTTVYHSDDTIHNTNIYRKTSFALQDVQVKEAELNQPENMSLSTAASTSSTEAENDADDDDEYEYVEFDSLTEEEFIGSEWIVGTNWDKNPNKIDETWTRLVVDKDGKNIAAWGDDSKGTWTFDVPSQFLSISKENLLAGKQIWACTISDYYYLQGTVRGWTYWSAAAVIGQWQARRLGVDKDEAGTPPWFMVTEEDEATDSDDNSKGDDEATDLTTVN